MKHYLSVIILALLLVSCSEDDSPAPNANRLSKVIGNKIYTLMQGNNQTGAPGQFLKEEIKILITDLQGKSLRAFSLENVLSDESGSVYHHSFTDTVTFKWKLGCGEKEQKITVRDLNVCGVAKDKCIEADIFDIKASATEDISSGWYMPCINSWLYMGDGYFVNDESIAYLSGDKIISTKDLLNPEWKISTTPYTNYYQRLEMISSGEIFYEYYQYKSLYSPELNTWREINSPYSYYTNVEMDVTENGNYFLVGDRNTKLFKSNDGSSWSEYMDLNVTTNGNGYMPQILAVDRNSIYVVTNNQYVTEINTLNDKTEVHHFGGGILHTNYDLGNLHAEVEGNLMFIKLKNSYSNNLVVLDLSNNTKQIFNLGYHKMFKSAGKLYLISNFNDVRVWDNNGFKQIEYASPFKEYTTSAIQYGIFKGSPIGFINNKYNQQINSSIIYYIE